MFCHSFVDRARTPFEFTLPRFEFTSPLLNSNRKIWTEVMGNILASNPAYLQILQQLENDIHHMNSFESDDDDEVSEDKPRRPNEFNLPRMMYLILWLTEIEKAFRASLFLQAVILNVGLICSAQSIQAQQTIL